MFLQTQGALHNLLGFIQLSHIKVETAQIAEKREDITTYRAGRFLPDRKRVQVCCLGLWVVALAVIDIAELMK